MTDAQARDEVARRAAFHRPPDRDPFAQRGQRAGQRGLGGDREHQTRDRRAQVALRSEDEQAAGTPARQDHADAEQQAADRRAGQAAAGRDLARVAGVEETGERQRLGRHHRGGEGEQPHRELAAGVVARELDHRRAQAEARALGEEAEADADHGAEQRQRRVFAQAVDEAFEHGVSLGRDDTGRAARTRSRADGRVRGPVVRV
jgi:hypothetical protein